MGFEAPGAPQTPEIDHFRPAQNSCIKNPGVKSPEEAAALAQAVLLAEEVACGEAAALPEALALAEAVAGVRSLVAYGPKPYKFIGFGGQTLGMMRR